MSRWRLWEGLPKTSACDGHPGQTHLSEIALAERLCRVRHRVDPDLLDHVIVMGESHLRRLLRDCANYYSGYHTHLGLDKDTLLGRPAQHRGRILPIPKLGGLHHAYVRI